MTPMTDDEKIAALMEIRLEVVDGGYPGEWRSAGDYIVASEGGDDLKRAPQLSVWRRDEILCWYQQALEYDIARGDEPLTFEAVHETAIEGSAA